MSSRIGTLTLTIALATILWFMPGCSSATQEAEAEAGNSGEQGNSDSSTNDSERVADLEADVQRLEQNLSLADDSISMRDERISELEVEVGGLREENEALVSEVEASAEEEQAAQEASAADDSPAQSGDNGGTGTATIEISGTEGVAFECFLSSAGSSRSVEGVVPATFEIQYETGLMAFDYIGASCSKAFSMQPQQGTLKVDIVADGQVVNSAETSSEFGMVNASWDTMTQ